MPSAPQNPSEICYHCGESCDTGAVRFDGHVFCCSGCQAVYQIIENNGLCQYYDLDNHAGIHSATSADNRKWQFLDDENIASKLTEFKNETLAISTFHVPAMHCSSCIYLLENLSRIATGIFSSDVNFLRKEITVKYDPRIISLRRVVETLSAIGYVPSINLSTLEKPAKTHPNRQLYYKIGIAGFCFGNIMILSLPEYFDLKGLLSGDFIHLFRYLNLLLILPVLLYSASDYFRGAWYALRDWRSNMDVAITLGISALAVQSFYDVLAGQSGGYFDSLSGLVFFLLIGKFVQARTFESLSFDRDYKSYFPLSITRIKGDDEKSINVNDLMEGDEIIVHHQELIPADSILENGETRIDYSFVTGESRPVYCAAGAPVYAGGRNQGQRLRLRVLKTVSQSYLTRLWNDKSFQKTEESGVSRWANRISNYFTVSVISLAAITGLYWKITDPALMMRAVTAVLIVACPCALALSIPFTFGQIMRILGKNGLYLKNGESIEKLAAIDTMVFDKTGTLTELEFSEMREETPLTAEEETLLAAAAAQSMHPVSRGIHQRFKSNAGLRIANWSETVGQGISAGDGTNQIKIGNKDFVDGDMTNPESGRTYIAINGAIKGSIRTIYKLRDDIKELVQQLDKRFGLYLLSGDGDAQRTELEKYFQPEHIFFNKSPQDKLIFIQALQEEGHHVMMTGDGLNDAGALKASDFGITVTNDINAFTPASDAILDVKRMGMLPHFAALARDTRTIVNGALLFSIIYNCIGLSFAMRGALQPWLAAILMPLSSISVVLYTRAASVAAAKKNKL